MTDVRVVAEDFAFLEGPRWHNGSLYVSDFYRHTVFAFDSEGSQRVVCEVEHQPSGLGFTPEDELLVVSMLDRRLLRWDGKKLHDVADMSEHMGGPANDMVVDRQGRAYVGNFGEQVGEEFAPTNLVRVDPDGAVSIAAPELVFPNGTVISPDGRSLLISETFANRITAFDVAPDGSLANRREWALLDGVQTDGLALDQEAAVWIGDAGGSGSLRVLEGKIVDRVDTKDLAVYAVALGGEKRTTLYMCAGPPLGQTDPSSTRLGVLLACEVDVPGDGLP